MVMSGLTSSQLFTDRILDTEAANLDVKCLCYRWGRFFIPLNRVDRTSTALRPQSIENSIPSPRPDLRQIDICYHRWLLSWSYW